ncbi:MAG TPA: hypothetical protein PLV83_03955 [Bacilli bacterium]|nr:hypothetical protein [Bacilli bacterium]
MLTRVFCFLTGFGLTVIGCVYIICYLNLLTIGYNFLEYVQFIIRKVECLFMPIGVLIMILCVYVKRRDKNDIYI